MNVRKVVCAAVAMLVMLAASVNAKPEPKPEPFFDWAKANEDSANRMRGK